MNTRILTGITTTGTPHLGNYTGAIRPALQAAQQHGVENFYFLADFHALIKSQDAARVQRSTLEIAATWLACGLDPAQVWFYRQSDIPEIPQLYWLLCCVASKGLLNRAHAYKAASDKNRAEAQDEDAGISAGLFMYPVLMAADILMFNANHVPVGRDQVQHIEMARDFAQRFNHIYGEYFVLPEAVIEENVATLPGLDGRKMSKSYDNTIPLFASTAQLKKSIAAIITDSLAPGQPKQTEGSALFQLYQAFASAEETAAMAQAYADGIGWGEAKQQLLARIEAEVAPMREKYHALMAQSAMIEDILQDGAARLRARYATPLMQQLREAVGLRNLAQISVSSAAANEQTEHAAAQRIVPVFKQYRGDDGQFYFKLIQGESVLLQSAGFAQPRDAGQRIAALKRDGVQSTDSALLAEGISIAQVHAALQCLAEAEAEKQAQKTAAKGANG